jgi:hypothetical protein
MSNENKLTRYSNEKIVEIFSTYVADMKARKSRAAGEVEQNRNKGETPEQRIASMRRLGMSKEDLNRLLPTDAETK